MMTGITDQRPRPRIVEVGPRDGLQTLASIVPTGVKRRFVDRLAHTGVTEIEVTAFVSRTRVPQLADADALLAGLPRRPGVCYSALVATEAGLERAMAAEADKVAVLTAASETFNARNIGTSVAGSLERAAAIVRRAACPVRGYLSTAFHCPFEGSVVPERVAMLAAALLDLGCTEVSIGDTTGAACPKDVARLLDHLLRLIPPERLGLHCHDTNGQAVANVREAARYGLTTFDGSAGGVGGCPFAPGAPGNLATEALATEFPEAGLDVAGLREAAALLAPYRSPRTTAFRGQAPIGIVWTGTPRSRAIPPGGG